MNSKRFSGLAADKRALVAMAVLLDGREAINYLSADAILGDALTKAASELANVEPELRMPLVGTLLREAKADLKNDSKK